MEISHLITIYVDMEANPLYISFMTSTKGQTMTKVKRNKEKPIILLQDGDIIRGTDRVNPFNNYQTALIPLWCKVSPEYVGKPYIASKYLPMRRK